VPDDLAGDWPRAPLIWRRFPSWVLFGFFRLWGYKITGLENVPETGGMILSANHVSNLDGPVIGVSLSGKRFMRGMGKAELYSVPVLGWFLRKTGTFPVDRRGDVAAMRTAAAILAEGGCLLIMPEGTRSKDGKPGKPRAGVGFLAGMSRAPVVPARLIGTDGWPWRRLEVRFGPPMRYEGDPNDREATLAFAQKVMDRVFSL
jgi:1-acyl-sn-glycerol-3-phosphate acyltransferase